MNSVLEVLYLRRPSIDYICPPVCAFDFSSTGGPVIELDALGRILAPSGFILSGRGNFRLSWNNYPGAICYTVYKAVDPNNPNGEYTVIAECIPDPAIDLEPHGPGCYRVSAITLNGESELSAPICGVGECPFIISGASPTFQSVPATDSAQITAEVGGVAAFFHWYKDGVLYSDTTLTTQSTLNISSTALSDSGFYSLIVGNGACQEESGLSQLQVTSVGMTDPIAFWKMDGLGNPVDEVGGYTITNTSGDPAVGIPGDSGKIIDSFRMRANAGATGTGQNGDFETAFLSELAPTANGMELLFWLRFNNVVTPGPLGVFVCECSVAYLVLTDSDFGALGFTYEPLNAPGVINVGFGAATLTVPFTHTLGLWQFFRLQYNRTTGKVRFSVDNGVISESAGTQFLAGVGVGGLLNLHVAASPFQEMSYSLDEFGIFDTPLNDVEAGDWWNSGAGRTYP